VHLPTPHETPALEIEEQEFDLLKAPVRGDGVHDAPRADLQEVAGHAPLEEIELLRQGAEKGLSGFQLELGERYARGFKGVPKDCVEARKWLTRALHDPEFPEHKDQAAALLNELKSGRRAGPGKAASRFPWTAKARLGSLKTWQVIAAIAAVAIAVLLWVNR
jgi:TPR repeat protein